MRIRLKTHQSLTDCVRQCYEHRAQDGRKFEQSFQERNALALSAVA